MTLFGAPRTIETDCTIAIEQSPEHFHAHVELDGGLAIGPGDRVQVHGAPVFIAFGERRLERRRATVHRAGWLQRVWMRCAAWFELSELYDVSFTTRRTL